MPKGYGYDKPPKKASGFKMRGFSYPGQSPIKGKKKAEETAAQQQRADAMEGLQDLEIKGESTNLLQGTNTLYGNVDSPFNKRTLVQDIHRAPIKQTDSFGGGTQDNLNQNLQTMSPEIEMKPATGWQKFKSSVSKAASTKIGETVGTAVAQGLVNLGVNALSNIGKKEKPKKGTNVAEGFSQVQIGRNRT